MTDPGDSVALVLAAGRRDGRRVAVALGAFGLIHAGTLAFFDACLAQADQLVVGVLAPHGAGRDGADCLLRPDERLRIFRALEVVSAAETVADPSALRSWHDAGADLAWHRAAAENDLSAAMSEALDEMAITVRTTGPRDTRTTGALVARMKQ